MAIPLTEESLKKLVSRVEKAPNYLTMVIRGHYVIEQTLDRAILKYSQSGRTELARIPFSLKLDLAVMLGVIPKDSLPLFRAFNSIRNRYAHNPFALLQTKDARDLANCLSSLQKRVVQNGNPKEKIGALPKRELLWRCTLAMFAELYKSMLDRVRENVAHGITMQKVKPLVEEILKAGHVKKHLDEFEAEVDNLVNKTPLF